MESFNLKILPFAISALIFSYLTFNICSSLITEAEITIDFTRIGTFIFLLVIYTGLMAMSIAIFLSQIKYIYFRIAFFFILFLPYATIFLLKYEIDPKMFLAIFVIYIAMVFSIITEFNSLYGNQIKTYLSLPARANARTIAFFIALVTALVFLSINNTESGQVEFGVKMQDKITTMIVKTIEDYDLIGKMGGQLSTGSDIGSKLVNTAIGSAKKQIMQQLTEQITTMIEPYIPYMVYFMALLIFLTIAGATAFISFFITLLGYVLTYILKSVGYLKETKQTIEVTRFTL
jgi:hypothetical protein